MRTEIITGPERVAEEIARASRLMTDLRAPVTARETWLLTALRVLHAGRPWAVVVRSDGGATTGLALLTTTRRPGFASTTLLGHGVSDQARLLATDAATARAVADAIRSELQRTRRPWRLHIEQVPAGDPVLARLAESLPHTALTDGDVCPVTRFGEDRSLSSHLSRNGRGIAAQGRNRLDREDPDWHVERTRDPDAIAACLPLVVAMHRRRDHALGRRSDLDIPHRIDFYTQVAEALSRQDRLELALLKVRGAVAAYLVVIRDGDVWCFWDNRISVEHGHLHAGRVLDTTMLAAALEEPSVTAVDWMRGMLQHKKQASNDVVRTARLTAWSGPLPRAVETVARQAHAKARATVPAGIRERIRGRNRGVRLPAR